MSFTTNIFLLQRCQIGIRGNICRSVIIEIRIYRPILPVPIFRLLLLMISQQECTGGILFAMISTVIIPPLLSPTMQPRAIVRTAGRGEAAEGGAACVNAVGEGAKGCRN